MPTTTITKEQREGLYELVRNHLAGLGDVWVAMEQDRDFATAERLGLEFAEDVRDEAEQVLTESPAERRSREEDEETNERFRSGLDACEELLVALDEQGGDSA